jgi:hypothetical protein
LSQPEPLILSRPFGRRVAQIGDADAAGEPTFDHGLDQTWSDEGHRDCHVDVTNAAFMARGDVLDSRNAGCDSFQGAASGPVDSLRRKSATRIAANRGWVSRIWLLRDEATAWWWMQSDSNPSPPSNSLLTGKLTGNFAKFSISARIQGPEHEQIQWLAAKFPTHRTGNYFRRNREFWLRNPNHQDLHHSFGHFGPPFWWPRSVPGAMRFRSDIGASRCQPASDKFAVISPPFALRLSMLSAPAPNATIWSSPPAIITFLKKWIIWFGSAKLLWKAAAAASEKSASAVATERVRKPTASKGRHPAPEQ